ncbi:MAG: carbohydrate ABC transporter permease [Clostridiales bacterium]|nr:carbohydrate ABC transporter permease [Clostridiales bacterium]PWM40311.1 MAG: carbohydrate ABC transporter permease [Clostridiales bacterium]
MKTNTAKNLPLRVLKQIILILFALIVLYPIFFVFITSFKSNFDVISNPFGMSTFQPENYIEAWQVGKIGDYFLNSVYVTAITLIIQMVVIVLASYSFAKLKPWGHKVLFILFLTGLFITTEMVTVPNFSTMKNLGLMDTKISLILPYVSTGIALATYIATNYISSLPKELDEAAIIDGCNIVQLLTKIALPLMRPILATIFIFNFQGAWSEFYWALIMIRSEENKTLQLGLMNFQSQFNTDYGVLTAGLVIATLPILIIYLKFSSQFIGGMTVGAVKG